MPIRPTWSAGRPSRPATGPPGLAALIDAERSALREHHDRLRSLQAARQEAAIRATDVEAALQRQKSSPAGHSGMRDRLRMNEQQARLLVADVRARAAEARSSVDAAEFRTRASEQRLDEIRKLIDGLGLPDPSLLDAIRRSPELPPTTVAYPSIAAFIEARPERAQGDRRLADLIGRPLGDRWSLESEATPWVGTRWRAAWSCDGFDALGEIYAVELVLKAHPVRRVLLLGTAPADPGNAHRVEAMLAKQGERNSLAALAAAACRLH
ncbi:MAG: hypothetical protein Q7T55_16130 [Solirubrobacteraceae bacterium]|nr:hypothetical protein [Solirubrobacteraceae bacterium]